MGGRFSRAAILTMKGISFFLSSSSSWLQNQPRVAVILLFGLAVTGCSLTPKQIEQLQNRVEQQRDTALTCPPRTRDRCADDTPLAALVDQDRHYVVPLEIGADALAARVHLLRSARERIEIQNYVFFADDSGRLLLDEMIAAARRGVRVRLLVDALFSLPNLEELHRLVTAHERLEVRMYNLPLGRTTLSNTALAAGVLCCFRHLNHRMHFKLVVVDDRFAILGGRNTADRYFDLDTGTSFLDFEVLVISSEARTMREIFDVYWRHRRTAPAWHGRDVARLINKDHSASQVTESERSMQVRRLFDNRAVRLAEMGGDAGWQQRRLMARVMPADEIEYFWDPADRPNRLRRPSPASERILEAIAGAADSVHLQSPYFVMSRDFRKVLKNLPEEVSVKVSTNSLASTDAFPAYAIQRRQRHMALDRLRIEIFELKPYPADRHHYVPRYAELIREKAAGIVSAAPGDLASATREAPGPRLSLHAKVLVIDDEVSLVTSHNLDPRSEHYNTENGVVVRSRAFARFLRASIERAMAPRNAWYVGPRYSEHPASRASRAIAGWSRRLPTLDLWPVRHTQNYQLPTGGHHVPWWHEDFFDTWEPAGDMPEVTRWSRRWATDFISRMTGFLEPLM